jgi:methyl-accepting chemotaxis protein
MVSVANTITEITSFLGDIEEVGSEIELIALNASIKAAHTGDKGAALGVLASSIQRLSQDARGLTESTADVLRTIYSSAETLKQNAESYMDTSQVESMVMRLAELVENLRRVNDEMVGAFAGTSSRAEELGRDIQKQTQSITFHAAVGNRLLEGRDRMEATSARAQELVPHEDDEGRPERLRKLLDRYTMEAERMIHETAFNLESMEEGAGATGEEAGADGEDDWDNVELF